MTTRELLQMALEFIESVHEGEWASGVNRDDIQEAIRTYLAKPERDDLVTISKKQLRAWLEDGRDDGTTDWRGENEL